MPRGARDDALYVCAVAGGGLLLQAGLGDVAALLEEPGLPLGAAIALDQRHPAMVKPPSTSRAARDRLSAMVEQAP